MNENKFLNANISVSDNSPESLDKREELDQSFENTQAIIRKLTNT